MFSLDEWCRFVEMAPLSMALFDTKMQYLAVSPEYMCSWKILDNPVGKSLYEVNPNRLPPPYERHERVLSGEVVGPEEMYIITPENEKIWFWGCYKPVYIDGEVKAILMGIENITERKVYERNLKLAHEDVHRYVRSLVHDVRGPVSSASRFLDVIRDYLHEMKLTGVEREMLHMKETCNTLIQRVDNLTKHAQIKYWHKESVSEVSVKKVLTELFIEKEVEFAKEASLVLESEILRLATDQYLFETIFGNLIANVFRHSLEEKPEIYIKSWKDEEGLHFFFRDNGLLSSKEIVPEIFSGNPTSEKGLGVGLQIVKEAVHRLEGSVKAAVFREKNLAFHITLPMKALKQCA